MQLDQNHDVPFHNNADSSTAESNQTPEDQGENAIETEVLPTLLESVAPVIEDELPPVDPGSIVEEAEQLLREGAPHDFDVLVIGGGPGGYVAAIRAAQLGAHVGLVEERDLGGVCLNRGCIPTKALLESVDVMRLMRRAREYGISFDGEIKPDFKKMNERKRDIITGLRENVAHLLMEHNVEVIQGRARFTGEHSIEVAPFDAQIAEKQDAGARLDSEAANAPGMSTHGGQEKRVYTAVHIIIASGSVPQRLPVEGADLPGVITSDQLLSHEVVPENIVVAGAGAVGVEFAYLFHALGARSTLLEIAPQVLPQEDHDIASEMEGILKGLGIGLLCESKLERIEADGDKLKIFYSQNGEEQSLPANLLLMATGRRANTDGLGLEEAGIKHDKGRVEVDENCETNVAGVYAIGDCIRDIGWAHLASGEGTMVAEIVTKHPTTVDLTHVPSCYYTHPEIASVGKTREQAEKDGVVTRVGVFHFRSNGKAAAAGDHDGFVKIVVDDETETILGCQIIGPRATDIINEAVLALKTGQTIDQMIGAIHAHPTFSEALPEAALAARVPWSPEALRAD